MTLQGRAVVQEVPEVGVVVTIASVARECLDSAGGDWSRAAKAMRKRLGEDQQLFRDLMEPLLDQAIWSCIRKACHAERGNYHVIAGDDNSAGLLNVAAVERQKWLDYPLSGGMKLRDANSEKLSTEAAMHESFARGNAMKAEFMRLIARRIGGKTVGEALTEQQLTKIADKIFGRKGS